MAHRILVVDDEHYLADLVATALGYEGYQTATAGSLADARAKAAQLAPDLIVLDIGLPDGSGLDEMNRLVAGADGAEVIFLTARDTPNDRIAGLRAGGADYVTKPFSLEELVLRVAAVLRRRPGSAAPAVRVGDLVIDDARHHVERAGEAIELTPTEYRLLLYLARNAGQVMTKAQIREHVWQYDFGGSDSVVHTYISTLRQKLHEGRTPLLHTVPRVGYSLRSAR